MSATRLLVLGVVRARGRTHGYQLGVELTGWGAEKWGNTKWGSLYHALGQLTKKELLRSLGVDKGDTGQPRTEYEITDAGEAEFFRLLREALRTPESRRDGLCAALAMLDALGRDEAIALLRNRIDTLESARDSTSEWESGCEAGHVRELFDLWAREVDNGIGWAQGLIERLENGDYVMAGESASRSGAPRDGPRYPTGPRHG